MYDNSPQDTSVLATRVLRIATLLIFLVIFGRLYQLQIQQGDTYLAEADENRIREIETSAPRGVIYDRNGAVLVQNKPTFQISIVPEDVPFDDDLTEVDEEALEIRNILVALRADEREDTAVRIGEIMFQRLGRLDYAAAVEGAGITLATNLVANPAFEGDDPLAEGALIAIPDLSKALTLNALVALVQRAVNVGRLGGAAEPILILDNVNRIQAFLVAEESYRLTGVQLDQVPIREYLYNEQLSHILGFLGQIPAVLADEYRDNGYTNPEERVGISGLEYSYQEELRGVPGRQNRVVDILGREQGVIGEASEPIPGQSLFLSLDLDMQRKMYELLSAKMEETDAPWGVTISMNPQTGGILGMVSLPSFDNNIFAQNIPDDYLELAADERKPLINYAIGGLYPPGSVYKMVIAAAALQEGIVSGQDIIADNGPIYLRNRFAPDDFSQAQEFVSWNHKLGINHGPLNVVQALALSNDIYFYLIGGGFPPPQEFKGLGDRLMAKWSGDFNYGEQTGIDIPGEVAGLVPDDQWKRRTRAESWTTGDSYNLSIGQGDLLATPLQVLVSSAAIANGGKIVQPQLVDHIEAVDGTVVRSFEPIIRRELPLSPQVIDIVRQGMWSAVNSDFGTAIDARIDDLVVAGKTGTAEFCEWDQEEGDCRYRDKDDNLPTHAWYVGYAPYENPEIINVTVVYRGGEGSAAALPVTTETIRYYFSDIVPKAAEASEQ